MDDSNPNPTTRMPTPDAAPAPPPAPTFGGPPPAPPIPPAPAWSAPSRRDRGGGGGRIWTLAFGLFVLGLGVWFFLDRTLGLDMPTIRWSQLWPVILIVIGAVVLLGALRRERR
jgi:LiaI-LiaF-like transmembrane region